MGEYVMWFAIFAIAIICTILAMIFLWKSIGKFYVVNKLAKDNKWKKRGIVSIPMLGLLCFLIIDMTPTIVCVVHLVVFWLIFELIFKFVKKNQKYYFSGVLAIVVTIIYLLAAWYQARNVVETDYRLSSDKIDNFKIVMFSDSHLSTILDGEMLADKIKEMGKVNPDIVVIVGDFVDDSTKREDMLIATKAFSEINPKYGTYYVLGNHDKGYYGSREFTIDELKKELIKNKVNVLEDDVVELDDLLLVGRKDKSFSDRKEMNEYELDNNKFIVVLDHQPNDQIAEKEANADLVLSGHTHGGQLIPITYVGEWIGANDQTKGLVTKGNTTYIVSDGISDWEIPFKTGCKAEYVVIDIE